MFIKAIFNWFESNKKRAALLTIAWAAFILLGCLIPGRDVPSLSIFRFDKLVHFGIFAVFAFLFLCTFKRPKLQVHGLAIFATSALFGFVVELIQGSGLVEGRSFDLFDALADAVGALAGIVTFFILYHFYSKK